MKRFPSKGAGQEQSTGVCHKEEQHKLYANIMAKLDATEKERQVLKCRIGVLAVHSITSHITGGRDGEC